MPDETKIQKGSLRCFLTQLADVPAADMTRCDKKASYVEARRLGEEQEAESGATCEAMTDS